MASYAGLPFAERVEGNIYRVYFTSRDVNNRSHVGWVELDITRADRILRIAEQPLLGPGPAGAFDDAGATLSSIVKKDGIRYVYYVGWSLRQTVPYHLAIGLATGGADFFEPFVTRIPGPIIDRNTVDPLFCTAPTVAIENGVWRMWYVSGLGWPKECDRVVPAYRTRYATSNDGINWDRSGLTILEPKDGEYGFSRPSILFGDNRYAMWYSVRGQGQPYRLGFAQSPDGLAWTRDDDQVKLGPSADGWDSEMIAYPHVFDHGSDRYMLYCGNGFGRTGFGLAIRE